MTARKWAEVTREERYFTSILFHDVLQDSKPLWNLLQRKLKSTPNVSILDVGYEVCFFRDAYHAEPKIMDKRQRLLEKQTFDIVLWLSNQSLIIIEAKAQQGFKTEQLKMLCRSREIMLGLSTNDYLMTKILLVGLVSSRYKMKKSTVRHFDAIIVWKEISESYPAHTTDYNRADGIYGDKLID